MSADAAQLFDDAGGRKYVCASELRRFIVAARATAPADRALCLLLAYTGCRLSEALELVSSRLDPETDRVVLRTLKRRRRLFRSVPIPRALMAELVVLARGNGPEDRLWNCCRQTAWRRVKAVMASAGIRGGHAMPKGLRHGFGIANAEGNIPPALTQRWMGHARIETTAIYQHAVGREERAFAERVWRGVS